jgi:hypothetical protein
LKSTTLSLRCVCPRALRIHEKMKPKHMQIKSTHLMAYDAPRTAWKYAEKGFAYCRILEQDEIYRRQLGKALTLGTTS